MQITRDQTMLVAYRVPVGNSLLAALPVKDCQSLLERLETITLTSGEILYHHGEPISHVYFPTDTMVSLLISADGHQALEVGMVGREGMLGIPLALGVNESPVQAVVQGAGMALRMTSAHFRKEFQRSPCLQQEVYRYIYELMIQMTQTAACNRFHRVEARLARWLLMTRDRVRSKSIPSYSGSVEQYAGCAAGWRDQGGRRFAAAQTDQLQPRRNQHPRRGWAGRGRVPVLPDRQRHARCRVNLAITT